MAEGKVLFGTVGEPRIPPKVDFCAKSKEHYGTTQDIREAGYIMADGTMLDFSGRHEAVGYEKGKPKPGEPDYLKGQRNTDHRDVKNIIPGTEHQFDKMAKFMRECRAIRILTPPKNRSELNMDFIENITTSQENLLKDFEGSRAFVDISDNNGDVKCSEEFDNLKMSKLQMLIARCHDKLHPEA